MNDAITITSPSELPIKRHHKYLLATLILAALLRIGFALWLPSEPIWRDGETHYARVVNYILSEGDYPVDDTSSAPLLPLVLAGIYKLFGFNGTAARIVMAILGTLTCEILYLLGKSLFGKNVGLLAALILSVYPLHVYMSATYELAQPLFILLLCLTVYQLVSWSQTTGSWYKLISSGLLLGLATLAVPTILTAAPLIAIWVFFIGHRTFINRIVCVLVLTISCSIIVLSWSAYVYSGTGNFQIGSGRGAMALFNGNCSLAWPIGKADIADIYEQEGVPVEYKDAYEEYQAVMQKARSFPPGEARDAVYSNAVKDFFMERPKEAGLLLLRKSILYWCPYALTATKHSHNNNLTKGVQIVSFVPILFLALFGMYMQRNRINFLMPIYIVILSQWITYSIFFPTYRYRSHIDVILILLATPVIISILQRIYKILTSGVEKRLLI